MNSTNTKPMTIKEYKKNYYKVHAKELSEIDKDNLNHSKSILLYKILKNKKMPSYILNSSAYKTTQSLYQKEENRKKAIKIIKKKKYDINNTSQVSPIKNRISNESPTFFIFNLKEISHKKKEDSQQNKSYNNLIIYFKSIHNKNKSNEDILTDSYFTNKKYNDRTMSTNKKNINSYKAITPLGNLRNKKNLNDSKDDRNKENKNKKLQAVYKNKDNSHLFYHSKHNHSKSQKELSTINNFKDIKYPKKNIVNLNYNTNSKKSKYIKIDNNSLTSSNTSKVKKNKKIKFPKNNKNEKCDKNSNNNLNNQNINDKKEFDNLQIKRVELFTINNILIKENESNKPDKEKKSKLCFKNLEKEKCINFFFKSQNKKKAVNIDKEKKFNKNKENYTGFVLVKKKMGNIEEEIKLKDDIENIKTIFLNLLNDISDNQLEFITTKELTSLKSEINENINIINDLEKEKKENILRVEKIKEQEQIIQKKEEEFLKLQSEFEKLKIENDKIKEKLNSMEKESKKILEDNSKLKDEYIKYKNKKDEKMNNEIKDLEGKIKKYKEELKKNNNNIKNNFNLGDTNSKIKRMSVTYNFKFDTMLNNLEKKKNENKNKGSNANSTLSKLVIIDEKKILEDKEEIEEIEEKKNENEKTDEKDKEDVVNNKSNEINIIKDNNDINENKIHHLFINNDSNSHVSKNEIESKMVNNINNIQIIQLTDNAKDTKNDISDLNDNNKNNLIKTNDTKEKKMSKALNRFRKKMSQAQPNIPSKNYANERSLSCAKRSEKISGIARMLEQQMGRRDEKLELNEENKAATDDETDRELDIVKLIEKKPTYGGKKRKPTLKNKFNKEPVDE